MPDPSRATLATLKVGPNRTVLLGEAAEAGGAPRVIKRFHARHLLGRLCDARRARHERTLLEALRARGLPVPEPLEVRRGPHGWELVSAWIPGATTVQALLDARARSREPVEALARELGILLARVQGAGLDHRDLHAGNALVDDEGRPWLVDFAKARLRRRLSRRQVERDLVALAAGAREAWSFGLRARFFVAWLDASGGCVGGERAGFARRIERAARARRRRVVRASNDRWMRASGVCRRVRIGSAELLASLETTSDELERRLAALALDPAAELVRDVAGDGCDLLVVRAGERALADAWRAMGRARDHRLPCARPWARRLGPDAAALFALPPGARPIAEELVRAEPRRRRRAARGAGRLAGALYDRGLGLRGPRIERLFANVRGEVVLGPRAELVRATARAPWRRWLRAFGEAQFERMTVRERAAFAAGFVAELRGGPAERARSRAELRRG